MIVDVPRILSAAECECLVEEACRKGFASARLESEGRSNEEVFLVDSDFLPEITHRLRPQFTTPETGRVLEIYRYGPAQSISPHTDGGRRLASGRLSDMTLVIYLSDDFDGGATMFPSIGVSAKPAKGSAIAFSQTLLHAGQEVTRGTKYVARVDLAAAYPLRNV